MNETTESAESDLRLRLKVLRTLEAPSLASEAQAIAQNVLREELGDFGAFEKRYQLGDDKRDLLVVHGREDACAARILATRAAESAADAAKSARTAKYLLVLVAGCCLFLTARNLGLI